MYDVHAALLERSHMSQATFITTAAKDCGLLMNSFSVFKMVQDLTCADSVNR